jgi:hypothetical protein
MAVGGGSFVPRDKRLTTGSTCCRINHAQTTMELAAEARNQVNECEKEIAAIKAGLKSLGPASAEDSEEKNALSVVLLKVCL